MREVNRNKLADDLTDEFIEYEWRLQNPMPHPTETATAINRFQNDPHFRARVQNWVSGVMSVIDKHI